LRLLVDEDSQAHTLVRMLVEAGHDVLTAADAGLNAHSDADVLDEDLVPGRSANPTHVELRVAFSLEVPLQTAAWIHGEGDDGQWNTAISVRVCVPMGPL